MQKQTRAAGLQDYVSALEIGPAIRDDRINQEDRDEYTRALQQAATQRQEVTSARETASDAQLSSSDIIRRLDGISETLVLYPSLRVGENRKKGKKES